MTNPFAPQPAAPVQVDPAYAAFLQQLQQSQQAAIPAQYAPPAQQYPAPPMYGQQYPAAPPAPVQLAQGSLDDFYGQPSAAGGPGWKFAQIGATNVGIVSREIGRGDVEQVTDINGRPQTFKDGAPKFQLKVPMTHPDGTDGTWYVKGADRDELTRAMVAAGAPAGAPEKGAAIRVTFVKEKANGPGMSPSKVKTVEYMRPTGSAPVVPVQTTPQTATEATPAPVQQPAPVVAQPAPVQPAATAPAAVTLAPDQAALLAQLTGG